MVATSNSKSVSVTTTAFNAKSLSAVDAFFGVEDDDAQQDQEHHGGISIAANHVEESKGVASFLKTSMKRRRKDDIEETYEMESSDEEEEEKGRTFIAKDSTLSSRTNASRSIGGTKKTDNANSKSPVVKANNKPDESPKSGETNDPISKDESNVRRKRKKCRSRQKNIRKDNRDVKPDFTRDPTAPGYRPLTEETKAFLQKNKSKKSFSPLISKLNESKANS